MKPSHFTSRENEAQGLKVPSCLFNPFLNWLHYANSHSWMDLFHCQHQSRPLPHFTHSLNFQAFLPQPLNDFLKYLSMFSTIYNLVTFNFLFYQSQILHSNPILSTAPTNLITLNTFPLLVYYSLPPPPQPHTTAISVRVRYTFCLLYISFPMWWPLTLLTLSWPQTHLPCGGQHLLVAHPWPCLP